MMLNMSTGTADHPCGYDLKCMNVLFTTISCQQYRRQGLQPAHSTPLTLLELSEAATAGHLHAGIYRSKLLWAPLNELSPF
jgi:hypothetical protein